ncbi:MAG: adenylate/guanylate cyclase [Frankiales bacterium]|nr:adenylate/guanylate cyclase [Frankiales bacterium]
MSPSGPTGHGDLEEALLGAPCTLTREEVSALAGVPEPAARAVWVAMGFPEVAEGDRAFTERDAEALRTVVHLRSLGLVDSDTLLVLARAMGQGLSRLAEAVVEVVLAQTGDLPVEQARGLAVAAADTALPGLEQLVLHVWRRQFAAATARSLVVEREGGLPVLAVGFVDLVDFTRSTREWDASTLERTLERFERDVALRVTAVGGRVVKTLGDEVLFVTGSASSAVAVALDTVEAHDDDDELPSVRAGVALGPVLVRMGDVFGQPVNLASRLTDEARPGTVLVDVVASGALPDYDVRALRRRSVRGYRSLVPHLVRRRPA